MNFQGRVVLRVHLLLLAVYYYYYYKCSYYSATITAVAGHFTKFKSKTVAQLNADVCRRSERTTPSRPYDWRKRWDLVSLRNVTSEEQARTWQPPVPRAARSSKAGICAWCMATDWLLPSSTADRTGAYREGKGKRLLAFCIFLRLESYLVTHLSTT